MHIRYPTYSRSHLTNHFPFKSLTLIAELLRDGALADDGLTKHFCGPNLETTLIQHSFPCCSDGKVSACNAGDQGSIPGLGRSPGEGNGNPLQYSCLENPMDREA